MDRVPYRRVTPPRHGAVPAPEQNGYDGPIISHGETLIMQCIISGIIMVFVLIAGMTDAAPAAALRNGINRVLTGAETLDELITDVRRFGSDWLGWEPVEEITAPDEFYAPADYWPAEPPATNFESAVIPTMDYNINETPAADEQASNPAVPEPPVTPGLWD